MLKKVFEAEQPSRVTLEIVKSSTVEPNKPEADTFPLQDIPLQIYDTIFLINDCLSLIKRDEKIKLKELVRKLQAAYANLVVLESNAEEGTVLLPSDRSKPPIAEFKTPILPKEKLIKLKNLFLEIVQQPNTKLEEQVPTYPNQLGLLMSFFSEVLGTLDAMTKVKTLNKDSGLVELPTYTDPSPFMTAEQKEKLAYVGKIIQRLERMDTGTPSTTTAEPAKPATLTEKPLTIEVAAPVSTTSQTEIMAVPLQAPAITPIEVSPTPVSHMDHSFWTLWPGLEQPLIQQLIDAFK